MLEVWAGSLSPFVPTRFIGIGQWESAQARLEPGCSLAQLLTELGLDPVDGDEGVSVRADGTLDRPDVEEGGAASSPSSASNEVPSSERSEQLPWGADPVREQTVQGVEKELEPVGERDAPFSPWGESRTDRGAPRPRLDGVDWSRVVFLVSGRGGVGRSLMGIAIAERAAGHLGRNVVLVDANVGQAGLATNLRVVQGGVPSVLPTIADLRAGASVQHVVSGPDQVRRAGGIRVDFACVLAPDPDQATADACSPRCYRQVIDELAPVSDLIVVDTTVAWQSDPTSITTDLVAPGLRSGASILVVTDPSLEGAQGARRLVRWATRLAPGRVAGLLNKAPVSAVPDQAEASKLFAPVPCLAVVPYVESVGVAAARGRPVGRLTGLAADKVLAHLGVA